MRSTPRGMGRGYTCLFIVFSETLSGLDRLDSWEKFDTLLYIFSAFLAKERSEVLQHLLGFLWLSVLIMFSLSYL